MDYSNHILMQKAKEHNIPVVAFRERFTLSDEPIGSGAFGYVYSAIDNSNGESVAVKVLNDPKVTDETVVEFQRVMKIPTNPYVVNYRELLVGTDTNGFPRLLVVMDLIVGSELFEAVVALQARNAHLNHAQLFNIFFNLEVALQHIHQHGVAHRDIKPENIMIRASDQMPVIVDFGLSCISNEDCTARGYAGTPGYLAPEFWAQGPQSGVLTLEGAKNTDMFALGATFFMCLTFWTYSTYVTAQRRKKNESPAVYMEIYRELYARGPERWAMPAIRAYPRGMHDVPEFSEVTRGLLIMDPNRRMGHDQVYDILIGYYNRVTGSGEQKAQPPPPPPQPMNVAPPRGIPGPPPLDDPSDPPPPIHRETRDLNMEFADAP